MPEAWHTNDATPPDTPIWSVGILVNFGEAVSQREVGREGKNKNTGMKTDSFTPRGHQTNCASSNNTLLALPHFTVSDCVLCLLPGYHLEDTLKDFLWVINKRLGWASEEHLSLLPPLQATLHAAQPVMTHECFTGRGSVGCKFTAYNWFKCINTRGVILCCTLQHLQGMWTFRLW